LRNQIDISGDILTDQSLGTTDSLVQWHNLDTVFGAAEDNFGARFDAEVTAKLSRYYDATRRAHCSTDGFTHYALIF
jgi:hypothetical protein